jgi:hypothetical protein
MPEGLTERERLELFVHRVRMLSERRLVREGMQSRFNLKFDNASRQLRYKLTQPDEEDLRSFMLDFRFFVAQKDPVYIYKVFKACSDYLDSSFYREQLEKAKAEWKRAYVQMGAFGLVVDGRKLAGQDVLDLYINGHYFHNDVDKAAELRRLNGGLVPMTRFQFLAVLPDLVNVVFYVGEVVQTGLAEGLLKLPLDR